MLLVHLYDQDDPALAALCAVHPLPSPLVYVPHYCSNLIEQVISLQWVRLLFVPTTTTLHCIAGHLSTYHLCHLPYLQSGCQIIQTMVPIAEKGFLEFVVRKDLPGIPSEQSGHVMRVAIKQIHLEQDSGRIQYNLRDPDGNTTMVDFRRSGVPLMMSLALTHT